MEVTDHGQTSERAYLEAIRGRYRKANRAGKARILDEFCAVCGYHRKYAIRLLGRKKPALAPRRVGRKPSYDDPLLLEALRRIWLASDQLCSKRLKVALPLWLPHYEPDHGALPEAARTGLLAASASTLDRLLKAARVHIPRDYAAPSRAPCSSNRSPSAVNIGMSPSPASSKPTRWPIAAIPWPATSSGA